MQDLLKNPGVHMNINLYNSRLLLIEKFTKIKSNVNNFYICSEMIFNNKKSRFNNRRLSRKIC